MCEGDRPVCWFHQAVGYDMRAETALEVFYQPQSDQHIGAGDSVLRTAAAHRSASTSAGPLAMSADLGDAFVRVPRIDVEFQVWQIA